MPSVAGEGNLESCDLSSRPGEKKDCNPLYKWGQWVGVGSLVQTAFSSLDPFEARGAWLVALAAPTVRMVDLFAVERGEGTSSAARRD
eukprot:6148008-Pleurochrysis_carterae.AAC.1